MPGAGLEPARAFGQRILSPLRLPFRHPGTYTRLAPTNEIARASRGGPGRSRASRTRASARGLRPANASITFTDGYLVRKPCTAQPNRPRNPIVTPTSGRPIHTLIGIQRRHHQHVPLEPHAGEHDHAEDREPEAGSSWCTCSCRPRNGITNTRPNTVNAERAPRLLEAQEHPAGLLGHVRVPDRQVLRPELVDPEDAERRT